MDYDLIATSTFGIESITAKELKKLGYEDLVIENGKVTFSGDEMDIAITNTWLRTADRVLIKMAEFKATTFEELFQGTLAVDWGSLIPANGKMHVVGKSIKSTLFSVPDCQSIVKKAVVKSMQSKYNTEWFPEDGPVYKIEVALLKDIVTLTIDTTGPGLHKRGYRENAGEAPLKETLAASLVLISRWNNESLLIDPFCGSGTILIEAAMIGINQAPGLYRRFECENWPTMDAETWEQVREGAQSAIKNNDMKLIGYDINGPVLRKARENAQKAKIDRYIDFQKLDFNELSSRKKNCFIITNPPYGQRIGELDEVKSLYKKLGEFHENLPSWDMNILTSFEGFEALFGEKSSKNRKLYNGKIKCYYYQYLAK
jgi:putative N6-adenine-specific DNA methylase